MTIQSNLDIINWAHKHFAKATLGDQRRVRRVINIAQHLAHSPGKSIPQLFDNNYAIKASYELFKHEKSTPDNLQSGHRNMVYQELKKPGTYLLIEDTSELSWTGNMPIKGLGPIGSNAKKAQGFFLHTVLAVRWTNSNLLQKRSPVEVIGLADQQYKIRPKKGKKIRRRKDGCAGESDVWEKTIERLPSLSPEKTVRLVRVCDRGADIYEVLIENLENNYGFVIRASHDRNIESEQPTTLFKYARSLFEKGSFFLDLRSRPDQPRRTAILSISFGQVELKSPQRPGYKRGALKPVKCSVIRIWEKDPSEEIKEPIEWILLCDQIIETLEEAMICAKQYTCRWLIEDFHKALKTGLGAEKLQLEDVTRLFAAISIMSIVALRLIEIRESLRLDPSIPAQNSGLSPLELKILSLRLKRDLKTVKDVGLAIGRLGGHMNRKGDGMPGLLSLWRGMQRLMELMDGVKLAADLNIM